MEDKNILYVEDERITAMDIQGTLENKGYGIFYYSSGKKAMDDIEGGLIYQLGLIDLSLLDSTIDGEDVIKFSKERNPKVPIICVSGYDEKPREANAVLTKPFNPKKLDNILERYLG